MLVILFCSTRQEFHGTWSESKTFLQTRWLKSVLIECWSYWCNGCWSGIEIKHGCSISTMHPFLHESTSYYSEWTMSSSKTPSSLFLDVNDIVHLSLGCAHYLKVVSETVANMCLVLQSDKTKLIIVHVSQQNMCTASWGACGMSFTVKKEQWCMNLIFEGDLMPSQGKVRKGYQANCVLSWGLKESFCLPKVHSKVWCILYLLLKNVLGSEYAMSFASKFFYACNCICKW